MTTTEHTEEQHPLSSHATVYVWRDGVVSEVDGAMPTLEGHTAAIVFSVTGRSSNGEPWIHFYLCMDIEESSYRAPIYFEMTAAGILIMHSRRSVDEDAAEMITAYAPGTWRSITSGNVSQWDGETRPIAPDPA